MSLVLGITATLGSLGVIPAMQGSAAPVPAPAGETAAPAPKTQLASAVPASSEAPVTASYRTPATASTPEVLVDVHGESPAGITVLPATLAANAPVGKPATAKPDPKEQDTKKPSKTK